MLVPYLIEFCKRGAALSHIGKWMRSVTNIIFIFQNAVVADALERSSQMRDSVVHSPPASVYYLEVDGASQQSASALTAERSIFTFTKRHWYLIMSVPKLDLR